MTVLWPRVPLSESARLFARADSGDLPTPGVSHPAQSYAPVGSRVPARNIGRLHEAVAEVAADFGFPGRELIGDRALDFDRRVALPLRRGIDISWSEAGAREVWSFVAFIVLPDVTEWRWAHQLPRRNEERWIGRDLTRHTWGRIWWRVTSLGGRVDLLDRLNESELNQLVERRSIGGHPRLLAALSDAFLDAVDDGAPRRALVRDVSKRMVRRLPYLEDLAMTDDELACLSRVLVAESRAALPS